jgi:hypothetical protein
MTAMPKIGDIVYPNFKPQRAGKVIAVEPESKYNSKVTVKTLKGDVYTAGSLWLNSFTDLVESHERKAKNQRALLQRITSEVEA